MANKNKKIIYKITTIIFTFLIITNFAIAQTDGEDGSPIKNLGHTQNSINDIAKPAGYQTSDINAYSVVGNLIKVALSFLGILFLILVIVSGFQWMMAEGNEDNVKKAKARIKNATIGLAVVVLAYALTYFILDILLSQTIK